MISKSQLFFNTAYQIARQLAKEAIWYNDKCTWTGHQLDNINGQFKLLTGTLPVDPYNGLTGVAIFLSAIVKTTNDPILTKTLEGVVNNSRSILKQKGALGNYGVYSGKLGAGYHLWSVGKEQNRSDWRQFGLTIIKEVAEIALSDQEIDIVSGAAGAIPALLEIHREEQQAVYLEMAKKCGNFLIDKAQKTPSSYYWLTTPNTTYGLTGYSHGAAGIAVGLLELGIYTQNETYTHAAQMAFDYEDQWFAPAFSNWPDLRAYKAGSKLNYTTFWCHGAPGIALSRLRAYQLTGLSRHKKIAEIALKTTYESVLTALNDPIGTINFSLCHGIAGNADILLSGTKILGDYAYKFLAEAAGELGIYHFAQTGLAWPSGVNDPAGQVSGKTQSPSLMLGLAGTGYFFLRLSNLSNTKSVLINTNI